MGGVFDFFIIIINMTSSWSSCSSASSSTCTSCSLVLLDSSAMSTLPYVWLTCAFGHNTRGETHLVCYCASLESAWCPAWNQRRQPRGRARHPEECACGRARFGSAGKAGQTRIGTHACQIRIGEGPGQIRIGNAGGSNPKREEGRITKKKRDAGFYQRLFTGLLTKVFTAPSKNLGFYLGLAAPGFYLGKNLGRSPGVLPGMPIWQLPAFKGCITTY